MPFLMISKIFVSCERKFGYMLLLFRKPLETIVFNPKFYEPLRPITLSWKSIKLFGDNCCFVVCGKICVGQYAPNVCEF